MTKLDGSEQIFVGDFVYGTPGSVGPSEAMTSSRFRYVTGQRLRLSSVRRWIAAEGGTGVAINPRGNRKRVFVSGRNLVRNLDFETGDVEVSHGVRSISRLEVISDDVLMTTSNGPVHIFQIAADGTLGDGELITVEGSSTNITAAIASPSDLYYVASSGSNPGEFGHLAPPTGPPAGVFTTLIFGGLLATRDGVYDPYLRSIMLVGTNHIAQVRIDRDPAPPELVLDHGFTELAGITGVRFHTVAASGRGQLFVSGSSVDVPGQYLFVIDYARSRRVDHEDNPVSVLELPGITGIDLRVSGRPFDPPEEEEAEGPDGPRV